MANFDVSNLLTAQTLVDKKYAKPEMRMKPAPAFQLLTGNSNFLVVGAETLRTRDDRPIEAHLLKRTVRTPTATRTHDHTGTLDDSMKVELLWTTKVDTFSISLKLLDRNIFDFNTVLANKLEQACMNILEAKETEAIAYLRAQRATASAALKGMTFNAANDAIEITDVDKNLFFQRLKSGMRQNYFNSSNLDVIADSLLYGWGEYIGRQGAANATNLGYQFQGVEVIESIELADANYPGGVGLAFEKGIVGALNWIPRQNRQGWGDYNAYNGGYGTFNFMGYQFALHGYAQRSNTSTTNGDTQDVTMEFELSLDTSFNKAPLSTIAGRTDSVIMEFGQAAPIVTP